jgi:hypothetical protein
MEKTEKIQCERLEVQIIRHPHSSSKQRLKKIIKSLKELLTNNFQELTKAKFDETLSTADYAVAVYHSDVAKDVVVVSGSLFRLVRLNGCSVACIDYLTTNMYQPVFQRKGLATLCLFVMQVYSPRSLCGSPCERDSETTHPLPDWQIIVPNLSGTIEREDRTPPF